MLDRSGRRYINSRMYDAVESWLEYGEGKPNDDSTDSPGGLGYCHKATVANLFEREEA